MDLLRTAVVDITTLTATCRALGRGPLAGPQGARHGLRDKLRTELERGVEAYIDTLARSKRGVLDAGQLASCRVAAEGRMTRALSHQRDLSQLMQTAPGALLGVAAARQDLWRLAHLAIHLRHGVAALRASCGERDAAACKKAGSRLRRRLTRGLIAYARANQRSTDSEDPMILGARKAALRAIGTRGTAAAARLARFELRIGTRPSVVQLGVVKPLADLVLDWEQPAIQPRHVVRQPTHSGAPCQTSS